MTPKSKSRTAFRPLAFLALLAVGVISACATPAQRFERAAARLELSRELISGDGYQHVVFSRRSGEPDDWLRVYLGGDGSPWVTARWPPGNRAQQPATDPTPRNPVALRLLTLDPAPAFFVGRPCYHGRANDPGCEPRLWTHGRYSAAVVVSLSAAIQKLRKREGAEHIALFGFSGGGALALLVAARVPEVRSVVTLAANLDTDAWVRLHGYEPLVGSLNPARVRVSKGVKQMHVAAARDRQVPPELIREAMADRPDTVRVIEDADHGCCWEAVWPALRAEALELGAGP